MQEIAGGDCFLPTPVLDQDLLMNGLFSSVWYPTLRHVWRLATQKHYLTRCFLYSRYGWRPRYQETCLKVDGMGLIVPDVASFLSTYDSLFNDQIYQFNTDIDHPRILDLGANIGLGVLYFKNIFPDAEVTAFEADPKIFEYLEKNVRGNGLQDVQLINKAVWDCDCTLQFQSEGADGGRISGNNENGVIEVSAVDIRKILQENSYDFIKMDIEGAESRVVPQCAGLLDRTEKIFIEYHSQVGEKQCLGAIISLLTDAGFRIHVQQSHINKQPFLDRCTTVGYDMLCNIFGWRE